MSCSHPSCLACETQTPSLYPPPSGAWLTWCLSWDLRWWLGPIGLRYSLTAVLAREAMTVSPHKPRLCKLSFSHQFRRWRKWFLKLKMMILQRVMIGMIEMVLKIEDDDIAAGDD